MTGEVMRPGVYTRPRFWIGHGDPLCHPAWCKLQKAEVNTSFGALERRVGAINLTIILT